MPPAVIGGVIAGVGAIGGAVLSSGAAKSAANAQADAALKGAQIQADATKYGIDSQLSMYHQTRSDLQPFMTGGSNAFGMLANIFGFGGGNNNLTTAAFGAATPQGPQQLTPEQSKNARFDPTTGQITGYTDPTTGQFVAGQGNAQTGMFTPTPPQGQTSPLAAGAGQPNPQLATDLLTKMPGYQFGLDQGVQALDRSAASQGRVLSGAQLKDAQQYGQGYAMQNAWNPFISELNFATTAGANAAAGVGTAGTNTGAGIANTAAAGANAVAGSNLAAGQATAAGTVASGNAWGGAFSNLSNLAKGAVSSYSPLGSGGVVAPTVGLTSNVGETISDNPSIF